MTRLYRTVAWITFFGLGSCLPAPGSASTSPPSAQDQVAAPIAVELERLERELAELATLGGGVVGVGVIHLETGREVFLNGATRFPMASTYKVPIAVELLHRVDQGELRLDSMIVLQPGDISPGSGTLARLYQHPGVSLSLRNLMELMLLISDNSATDVVLRAAGGPQSVTERMRTIGLKDIRVDRSTMGLISDFLGIVDLPPETVVTADRFRNLLAEVTEAELEEAAAAFEADSRDTSTPEAMARLLELVWREEVLTPRSSALLLDIMRRSTTGEDRIKGKLPSRVEVSHKTGTIGGVTNDVGIIELPDDAGHVVTVVFIKESEADIPARERAIAQISRAVYDYFLFNPGGLR